jgi:preprotein translocase subunit SecD
VRDADQLIAGALRDIAAEAGLPQPAADAAWRAGRRRRLARLTASAASIAGAIALALTVVLPLVAEPGPAAPQGAPARLVSISLWSPKPDGAAVLAATAAILRQRAADLHLPDTQARVSGSFVVLTGPAADEPQLQALVASGVLNFRPVLLYQPYRGTTPAAGGQRYGDASLVNHATMALFSTLVCTPAKTGTWKGQVGYVGDNYDNPNAQVVSCDSSGGKYALGAATVRGTQISEATAGRSATSNQWAVTLTLNHAGTAALDTLTSRLYHSYGTAAGAGDDNAVWLDSVADVLDGNVISAPQSAGPILDGKLSIQANFTKAQAQVLAAQLRSGPLPAEFLISDISTSAASASS